MYVRGEIVIPFLWAMTLFFLSLSGCTNPPERVELPTAPVASPTSTVDPDAATGTASPDPQPEGPLVPFDGGRPEDLGPVPSEPKDGSSVSGSLVNIYQELTGASRVCVEEKP
jgi:hypothetical protein